MGAFPKITARLQTHGHRVRAPSGGQQRQRAVSTSAGRGGCADVSSSGGLVEALPHAAIVCASLLERAGGTLLHLAQPLWAALASVSMALGPGALTVKAQS